MATHPQLFLRSPVAWRVISSLWEDGGDQCIPIQLFSRLFIFDQVSDVIICQFFFAVCRAAQWAARKCNRLDKQIRIYKELEVNQRCFCLIGGSLSRHRCTFNLNTKRWVTCDSWHVWQQWLQISQPSNFPVHRQSCTSKWWKCKGSRYCCHRSKKQSSFKNIQKIEKHIFFILSLICFFTNI